MIHDKVKPFMSKIVIIKKFINGTKKSLANISKKSGTILIDSLEKYKLIRRLILVFILYLCYDIHKLTTLMYKETGQVDMQWVIYATTYTAMLTLFITFYTTSRVKEVDNEHKRGLQQQWIDKNNNGINDLEEGYIEEEFSTDDCNHYNEDDITEDFKNID